MKTMTEWMKQLDEKRAIAIGVAGALCALSLDAAAGHFAGRAGVHPAQWLPVTLGPAAGAMVLTFAIPNVDGARFRRAMLAIGGIVAALGTIGTAFHLWNFLMLLSGQPLSMEALETALGEAPPLFAPGGFLGLGAVLAAFGSTKLVVRFGRRGAGVTLTKLSAASHGQEVPHLTDPDLGVDLGVLDRFAADRLVDLAASARADGDLHRPVRAQPTLVRAVRRDSFWHRRTREWPVVEASVPWHGPCACEGRQTLEEERR